MVNKLFSVAHFCSQQSRYSCSISAVNSISCAMCHENCIWC